MHRLRLASAVTGAAAIAVLAMAWSGLSASPERAAPLSAAARQAPMTKRPTTEPLPFDLAYRMRHLTEKDVAAPSPDGEYVAYVAVTPPEYSERYQPNGTPGDYSGARVFITAIAGGRTWDACPKSANCWRPSWSPDSKRLAFYSDAGGPPQVWMHDLVLRKSTRVSEAVVKAKMFWGDQAQWSPDGRTVFIPMGDQKVSLPKEGVKSGRGTILVRRSGEEAGKAESSPAIPLNDFYMKENAAALAEIDVRTGRTRMLVSASAVPTPSVVRVSATGRWISYLSVYQTSASTSQIATMDLAVVPAAGGLPRVLVRNLKDEEYYHFVSNYRWHPSDDRLVYVQDGTLWLVDLREGRSAVPQPMGKELGKLGTNPLYFSPDGAGVLVGTEPTDWHGVSLPTGLALVPLNDRPARKLPLPPRWTFRELVQSDDRTFWEPTPGSCYLKFIDEGDDDSIIARLDLASGAFTTVWKTSGSISGLLAPRAEGVFARYSDTRTSQDIYWFPRDFSTRKRVTAVEPRLDSVRAGDAEFFETPVPLWDGSTQHVRSAVMLPAGAKRGDRLPGVVVVYPGFDLTFYGHAFGGGDAGEVPALLFTSRGYAVLLTDLPIGPTGRPGHPVQETVDVLLPQVRHAAELGYLDLDRLAILGHSYGGYAAAAVVTRTNLFRSAISLAGLYDLGSQYGFFDPNRASATIPWLEGGQGRMGEPPWSDPMRYIENSPYYQANRIETPLLLAGGDGADGRGMDQAARMFAVMQHLDKTCELAVYSGEGHAPHQWSTEHGTDLMKRIVDFLDRYVMKTAR